VDRVAAYDIDQRCDIMCPATAMIETAPRLPIENLEAEQSVLGTILFDNGAMAKVTDVLITEHFYHTKHQTIFRTMLGLLQAGTVIDQITLTDRLRTQGELKAVGGAAYLAELGWDISSTAKMKAHATIVRDAAIRRQVLAASDGLQEAIHTGAPVSELVQLANGIRVPLAAHEGDDLDVTEAAGRYVVTSTTHQVSLQFDRLNDQRGGVQAELTIAIGETELLGATDISLKSEAVRTKLASTLNKLAASIPWPRLIDRACMAVLHRYRAGEPVIVLEPSDSIHVPFVVNPIIYQNHQTLIFAPGGSLKSYLALFVALQVSHGASVAGLSALRVPVLYLDWELNAATVGGRLKALQAGHPELAEFVPYYRRCEAPLHQEVSQIARQVAELGVQLVIVDSVAMASGGDLASPDAAIHLQRALRMIGGASLVLAHTSKAMQEGGQEKTAYGTVFFRELARNVWELQRANGDHPVRIALHQKKNNFGPTHPALGFEVTFTPESVQVTSCNPEEEPEFEDRLPIPSRIRNLLEDGSERTARDIADELTVKLGTIKSALSRGNGHKWHRIGQDNQTCRWTVLRPK
jgi:DnaB-like helicase N terminal domain/AAA domain